MFNLGRLDPHVQRVSAWITIGGAIMSAIYAALTKGAEIFGALNWAEAILIGIGLTLLTALVITACLAMWRVFRPRPATIPAPTFDGLTVQATGIVRDVPPEEQLRRGIYVAKIEADTSRLQEDHIINIGIIGFNGTHRRIGITEVSGTIKTWVPIKLDDGRDATVERVLPTPVLTNPAGATGIPAHSEYMLLLEQVLRPAVAEEVLAILGREKVELNLSELVVTAVYQNDNPSVTARLPLWDLALVQMDHLRTCKIVSVVGTASNKPVPSLGGEPQ